MVLPFAADSGLREIYDRTIGYQASRGSPFSVWGQAESLGWLQAATKVAAAGLALAGGLRAAPGGPRQVAALGAAVLIALQLAATHWFYLYVVWFVPFVFVTIFGAYREPPHPPRRRRCAGPRPCPHEERRAARRAACSPPAGR